MDSNYWTGRVSRRTALRGTGVGLVGLAAAALIGCGGKKADTGPTTGEANRLQDATKGGAAGKAETGGTPVPKDQVRVKPGLYEGPAPASAAERNPKANAKYGGTLKMRYLDPPRMDLSRTLSCTIFMTQSLVSNKLTREKLGALAHPFNVEIEPDLAEKWESPDKGQTWIFSLHKGVKTHNVAPLMGREFNSEDVAQTIKLYLAGSQKDVFSDITKTETPDKYTVKVTLNAPKNDFPKEVGAWSYIYVKELIDNEQLRQEKAMGTGPFIQKEWTKKQRSVFTKNPDYFENGLPYVDQVELYVQDDANAARAGFKTDNYFDYGAPDKKTFADTFAENNDDMVGTTYPISRGANVNGWQYQMKNPIFKDERIRRALSLAFDRKDFDLANNGGDNQNPEGPFSQSPMPWPFMFDKYPTAKINGPWYVFDPAKASQMMQAAGYTAAKPLTLEMMSWYNKNQFSGIVIPSINNNLKEVKITWKEIDNPTHVTLMSDRNFKETIGFLWGPAGYSMDQWLTPFYHSKGSLNYGSIDDKDLDALLAKQRAETNPEAQKEVWNQINTLIHDKVYQAWWPVALGRTAWHNYFLNYRPHGLVGTVPCYAGGQLRSVWLDEGQNPGRPNG
ncbi:MAG: ABC transporter substrate-binding protein [Dehalococcoidia bacterium]|nr:MAG: ABC transporter substrate-binding protein [Dehalococcoidia bacterium]